MATAIMLPLESPDRVNEEILQFACALAVSSAAATAVEVPRERSLAQRVLDGARGIGERLRSALRIRRGEHQRPQLAPAPCKTGSRDQATWPMPRA